MDCCPAKVDPEPLSAEQAQLTSVAAARSFLSAADIELIRSVAGELQDQLGHETRCLDGLWDTWFLHTAGIFGKRLGELGERLIGLAQQLDRDAGWGMLTCDDIELGRVHVRCVEFHEMREGGGLYDTQHKDDGSLITLDCMLSEPGEDFGGGTFQTLEADGTMKEHQFEYGDVVGFVSHKYHCVAPLEWGERNVLIFELWRGEPRTCPHRCEQPLGRCAHVAHLAEQLQRCADATCNPGQALPLPEHLVSVLWGLRVSAAEWIANGGADCDPQQVLINVSQLAVEAQGDVGLLGSLKRGGVPGPGAVLLAAFQLATGLLGAQIAPSPAWRSVETFEILLKLASAYSGAPEGADEQLCNQAGILRIEIEKLGSLAALANAQAVGGDGVAKGDHERAQKRPRANDVD